MPAAVKPVDLDSPLNVDANAVNLIYKVDTEASEIDAAELALVLDALTAVLTEAFRITHPNDGELTIAVKPFQEGSFVMDIVLGIQNNPAYIFVLSHPEIIEHIKQAIKYAGFIKTAKDKIVGLIELLKQLGTGKPKSVEQISEDHYNYNAEGGSVILVNSSVHQLYTNPTIQNKTINIYLPAGKKGDVLTYLRDDPEESSVRIDKKDFKAIQSYCEPIDSIPKIEVLEGTTTKLLKPKSGNYGSTRGLWSFTVEGSRGSIKAKISDPQFLQRYANGSIRFFEEDKLKVRLYEKQTIGGVKPKMEYDIVEVIEYTQGKTQTPIVQPSIFERT